MDVSKELCDEQRECKPAHAKGQFASLHVPQARSILHEHVRLTQDRKRNLKQFLETKLNLQQTRCRADGRVTDCKSDYSTAANRCTHLPLTWQYIIEYASDNSIQLVGVLI